MLGEYKLNRCTRQCHALGRPLKEGEWYYSVITEDGDDYARVDYSAESWTEPPENAVGWWKKRMPSSDEKKMVLAPPEVLIDLLRQMGQLPAKAKSRYLLALMLMRRRIVRPADDAELASAPLGQELPTSQEPDRADDPAQEGETPKMKVEVIADRSVIELDVCQINRSESETLRAELDELLYCEAGSDDHDSNDN